MRVHARRYFNTLNSNEIKQILDLLHPAAPLIGLSLVLFCFNRQRDLIILNYLTFFCLYKKPLSGNKEGIKEHGWRTEKGDSCVNAQCSVL